VIGSIFTFTALIQFIKIMRHKDAITKFAENKAGRLGCEGGRRTPATRAHIGASVRLRLTNDGIVRLAES
jgi:hypothetical protein